VSVLGQACAFGVPSARRRAGSPTSRRVRADEKRKRPWVNASSPVTARCTRAARGLSFQAGRLHSSWRVHWLNGEGNVMRTVVATLSRHRDTERRRERRGTPRGRSEPPVSCSLARALRRASERASERARTRIAQTWRNVEGSAAEAARGARRVNFHEHHCDEARHGTPFRRPRRSSRDGDASVPLRCPSTPDTTWIRRGGGTIRGACDAGVI